MSRRARDRAHLIRTDDDALVSSEVGIAHPATVQAGYVVLILVFAGLLGVMLWAAVTLGDERPYYTSNANTAAIDGYTVYYDRAAEPYSGTPERVLTGVVNDSTCVADCNADANCRFFTYDQTHARCYVYSASVLPGQFAASAVPGPTQLNADVYVKTGNAVTQLRGALRNGNSTIF